MVMGGEPALPPKKRSNPAELQSTPAKVQKADDATDANATSPASARGSGVNNAASPASASGSAVNNAASGAAGRGADSKLVTLMLDPVQPARPELPSAEDIAVGKAGNVRNYAHNLYRHIYHKYSLYLYDDPCIQLRKPLYSAVCPCTTRLGHLPLIRGSVLKHLYDMYSYFVFLRLPNP